MLTWRRIGLKSSLAESPDHMQVFDTRLANESSGVPQQMPLITKFRAILISFFVTLKCNTSYKMSFRDILEFLSKISTLTFENYLTTSKLM